MRPSKIVLLVLYILFLLVFIGSLAVPAMRAVSQTNAAVRAAMSLTLLMTLFFIGLPIAGGIAAHQSGRNVAGWVLGCLFLAWVMPLVLVLLKDKEQAASAASRASSPSVAAVDVEHKRKLDELASLKEKGILSEVEYSAAIQKLGGGAGASTGSQA